MVAIIGADGARDLLVIPGSVIFGALPYGPNIVHSFIHPIEGRRRKFNAIRRSKPVAPKLTGYYSPLAPCLYELTLNKNFTSSTSVEFIEVDHAAQVEVGAQVIGKLPLVAEPSALISFGTLRQLVALMNDHGRDPEPARVLIVNSGFGIIGKDEKDFFSKSLFHFQ